MKDRNIDIEDVSICPNYDREHQLLPAVLNGRKRKEPIEEEARALTEIVTWHLLLFVKM